MQTKDPEERIEYYTWNNAIQKLSWSIAGGRKAYEALSKGERMDVRDAAKQLYELGKDYPTAAAAEKTDNRGFVYVIGHPAWPDHLKVGRAFDPESRLRGYQTGCPNRSYVLHYAQYFRDCHEAERHAHLMLDKYRQAGEWFYVDIEEAAEVINRLKENERCGKN